eukprot:1191099-Prorocentrum_minimum.AAC.12
MLGRGTHHYLLSVLLRLHNLRQPSPALVSSRLPRPLDPPYRPLDPPCRPHDPPYRPLDPPYRPLDPPYCPLDPPWLPSAKASPRVRFHDFTKRARAGGV